MRMEIIITADEALTGCFWDKLCEMREMNVWAINEGLVDSNEEFKLTLEEALELGVIK